MSIGSYSLGSLVRLSSNPFEALVDGVWTATDPTAVTLKVQNPAGTVSTYTYALSEVTKSAAGVYYKDVPMTTPGKWIYQFTGTGACVAKSWAELNIESDPIG